MNKLQELDAAILVTAELSVAVKELIAQEHHDAAAMITNKVCQHVEKCQKLLQEYKDELLNKSLQETVDNLEVPVTPGVKTEPVAPSTEAPPQ